jgi:cobalt-zinc-cadmium efflux system outer membrane protein
LRFPQLLVLCLAPGAALAQQPPPLSIEEAVAQAVKNNPRISASVRHVTAAREGVRAARALANPQVAFTPALISAGSDEEVLIQQPLEINGARTARSGVSSARASQAEAEAMTTLRDVVLAVKSSYYQVVSARERQALARDLLQSAEEFHRAAARQVELGSRAGIDQTHAAIEVARARQQLSQAEAEVSVALASLNTAMGRAVAEPVGDLTPFQPRAQALDREQAFRQALDARSELGMNAALVAEAQAEANLARAEGRPDIAPQVRAERVTRGVEGVGIGLAVTLPFLDHGSRRHRIRQAEETARARMDSAAATRSRIQQEVAQAVARVQAADSVARSFREGLLDQARRLLEASRVGFQAGASNILAVLEAQRSYRAVNMQYIDAVAALAQAHVELERATASAPVQLPRLSK